MPRCSTQAAVCLALAVSSGFARGGEPDALTKGRAMLAAADARGAAALVEGELAKGRAGDRAGLVACLRDAYALALKQAEGAGRADEAQAYRDDLEILNRNSAPVAARAEPGAPFDPVPAEGAMPVALPEPEPVPVASPAAVAVVPPAPSLKAAPPAPAPEVAAPAPAGKPEEVPAAVADPVPLAPLPKELEAPAVPDAPAAPEGTKIPLPLRPRLAVPAGTTAGGTAAPGRPRPPAPPEPAAAPAGATTAAAPAAGPTTAARLKEADAAFLAKRYDEANSLYRALDREQALPADRRDHWGYCRAAEVVKRINARPAGAGEWAAIDAEIAAIQKLSPRNWFGEYLRNRAAERNPGLRASAAKKANADVMVVRASSPEEGPALSPATALPAPVETANFRVWHSDRALAEEAAKAAEAARQAQVTRWTGELAAEPWSPRCEIYLYPNADVFSAETGQPKDSPGFSTMGMNSGKIVARRINLRADHPNALRAVLPHEVTHVVLADLFPTKQIPRWADEGVSVLSEPESEQAVRAAELERPLSANRLFKVRDLVAMDYPAPQYWGLYYAQSVSLTRFLVEQGTPAQFITFVRAAQQSDYEKALKQVYKIKGHAELQTRWLAYAKAQSAAAVASSAGGAGAEGVARR